MYLGLHAGISFLFWQTLYFKITVTCISGLLWKWESQSDICECFHWARAIFGLVWCWGFSLWGLEHAYISPLKYILSIVIFISIKCSLFLIGHQWASGEYQVFLSPPSLGIKPKFYCWTAQIISLLYFVMCIIIYKWVMAVCIKRRHC